jgi:hypothetical protein
MAERKIIKPRDMVSDDLAQAIARNTIAEGEARAGERAARDGVDLSTDSGEHPRTPVLRRAAICIGVNRAGQMSPLNAAAHGAHDFALWAQGQGCETIVLTDDAGAVTVSEIFKAIKTRVEARVYDQLIVYFSGHGILTAPGAEYWLLSDSPDNPNEAVNLLRSSEEARNSDIPHVVFISDACRSSVTGPPLSGVTGGVIFPSRTIGASRADIDVFYATRPGDPAFEVAEAAAVAQYKGIFTDCLLEALKAPDASLLDHLQELSGGSRTVITSRKLKPYLESAVPVAASAINMQLRQSPEVRVETALPKYFAEVMSAMPRGGSPPSAPASPIPPPAHPTMSAALNELAAAYRGDATMPTPAAEALGVASDVRTLTAVKGRATFETQTGFSVVGAAPVAAHCSDWVFDPPFEDPGHVGTMHIRLRPGAGIGRGKASTAVLEFADGTGAALAVFPEFICTVVVDQQRIVSVQYVSSELTPTYGDYAMRLDAIDRMRATVAVAARNGRFIVEPDGAAALADRIRQGKNLDPALGIYAAYAYAAAGRYNDVASVLEYLLKEPPFAAPFDVAMLATRNSASGPLLANAPIVPRTPMLGQGWALLVEGDALWRPEHMQLCRQLIPALWTTFTREGVRLARELFAPGTP